MTREQSTRSTKDTVDPRQIEHGWDVYAADDQKVGDVSDVHDDYVVVSKGWLFPSERYVPISAIGRIERERVYLRVVKDQVDHQNWDRVPERAQATQDERHLTVSSPKGTVADGRRGAMADDEETLQLREEELTARTETVETGKVEIRKDVVAEQQSVDVPVTREEVVIERRPVDRAESDRMDVSDIQQGEVMRVPLMEEQVSVEKRAVVSGEIEVGKRTVRDTERVSDTVHREEVVVDGRGDVEISGEWPTKVARVMRSRWEQRHGSSGRSWEQDEPAYRYGYTSANAPTYQDREWQDVEPELGRDWSRRYGEQSTWNQARENAREAWEEARRRT
jgi:uncharacterized protein (TIGR02271 family)